MRHFITIVLLFLASAAHAQIISRGGAPTFFGQVYNGVSASPTTSPYTFQASDCGKDVRVQNSATVVTETIPASLAPPAGFVCNITVIQDGTARVLVNGSAVTAATLRNSRLYVGTNGGRGSAIGLSIFSDGVAFLVGDGAPLGSAFDPARIGAGLTLSNSNLTATGGAAADRTAFGTLFHSAGKWAFRFVVQACSSCGVGLSSSTDVLTDYPGQTSTSVGYFNNGLVVINTITVVTIGTYATGDVLDLVVDLDAKTLQVSKNGGALSATVDISSMTTFNLSPSCDAGAGGDVCSVNGNPPANFPGVSPWG